MNNTRKKHAGTVYIASDDAVFSRMLELEMLEEGFHVLKCGNFFPGIPKANIAFPVFCICDADSVCAENIKKYTSNFNFTAVFSESGDESAYIRGDEIGADEIIRAAAESGQTLFLKRPFRISCLKEFFTLCLDGYCESGIRPVNDTAASYCGTASDMISAADMLSIEYSENPSEYRVFFRSEPVALTSREFELLNYLFINRSRPVSRGELAEKVWKIKGADAEKNKNGTNITDVYIRYLREKIDDRFSVKLIRTVRGMGYMIE